MGPEWASACESARGHAMNGADGASMCDVTGAATVRYLSRR